MGRCCHHPRHFCSTTKFPKTRNNSGTISRFHYPVKQGGFKYLKPEICDVIRHTSSSPSWSSCILHSLACLQKVVAAHRGHGSSCKHLTQGESFYSATSFMHQGCISNLHLCFSLYFFISFHTYAVNTPYREIPQFTESPSSCPEPRHCACTLLWALEMKIKPWSFLSHYRYSHFWVDV